MTAVDQETAQEVQPLSLEGLALKRGRFEAELVASEATTTVEIDLRVEGHVVGDCTVTRIGAGRFRVNAMVPEEALNDGVATVVFQERVSGAVVGRYVFRSGSGVDNDVVAELDALSAEFEALKRAFMAEAVDRKLRAAERPLIVEETVTTVLRELSGALGRSHPGRAWEE